MSRTFSSKKKAERWEAKTKTEIREDRYFQKAEGEKHTFGEMIDRYLSQRMPRKSAIQQKQQIPQLRWWKERLGDYRLVNVTAPLISQARDELAATPIGSKMKRPRAAATVNRYLAALSHVFTIAVREWEWLPRSPMERVDRIQEARGRVRFLDDDERGRLLEACRQSREPLLHPLVITALCTGCRQGELLGLRWSEADIERGVIRLLDTKNDERRAVPLTGPALEAVGELSKVRRIDDDRVFAITAAQLRGPWEKAVEVAKLNDFRFHDLRHTAASYLAMNRATLAEIAEILGHRTLQMVKRYSHLTEQHTSKVVTRMTENIFGGG